jgi:hypothetical protein
MKKKKIDINLKIFNNKVALIVDLLAREALGDFERSHPRIIPALLDNLKKGNPRDSLKYAQGLTKISENLFNEAKQIEEYIEKYMMSQLEEKVEGEGIQFLRPDGSISYSFYKDEKIVLGKQPEQPEEAPKKKTTARKSTTRKSATKKAPAKKRATKKKAKKEEE